jgi:hydrogenase-4 component F
VVTIWLPIAAATLPLLGSLAAAISVRTRGAALAAVVGATGSLVLSAIIAGLTVAGRPLASAGAFVYVDGLGGFFLVTVSVVVLLASLGSVSYVAGEQRLGRLSPGRARIYFAAFGLFAASMLSAVETANLGLLFILVEAATLASVVLVPLEGRTEGLEAGWRYVIISSLGITVALVGALFLFYAASALPGGAESHLAWPFLLTHAHQLTPTALRLGFLLGVVGYGTKVGLAPMHTWLPDAHAEAPAPASAMLSGALLNVGMYAIIRLLAIADRGLGQAYGERTLLVFGFLSVLVGVVFMIRRRDFKRLFAYSSVEHMGIIAVGLGFGGVLGVYGALLHSLNHSLGKTVLFLSGGTVALAYGTRRADRLGGVIGRLPLTGALLLGATLAILGAPPFGLFISEFTIVRAGLAGAQPELVALLLLLLAVAFLAFLRTIAAMLLGPQRGTARLPYEGGWERLTAVAAPVAGLTALLVLGIWIPAWLNELLVRSVELVR